MNETEQFSDATEHVQIKSNPGWPTVLGVIGIVWSSMSLLAAGCMFLLTPERIASWLPEEERDQLLAEFGPQSSIDTGLQVVSLLLAVLLLWGSISLLRRQAGSRPLLNIWGGISILLTVIVTPLAIMEQLEAAQAEGAVAAEVATTETDQASEDAASETEDSMSDIPPEATAAITVVSGACGGAVALIWPIIVICFINSRSGRQTIASWQ